MAVSTQRLPPPPMPLNLPEPPSDRERRGRPPSPLRNIHTVDPVTGEISEESSYHTADTVQDDRAWSQRSHSPSPSLTKFASNFAQRVGTLVGGIAPPQQRRSSASTMLSDAELEAEAEREREWSRREAEMILRREAEERKMVEDGVFALMNSAKEEHPLPPPPPRSQTLSNPPSPASSQKEKDSGWFTAVKNKLTPSKDPLTPAQQVIQEAKAKEKEQKKKGKERERSQDWPAVPSSRDVDPAFANLLSSASSYSHFNSEDGGHHTPPRPIAQYNPMMTPSPKRTIDSTNDTPPMYAQFNAQGAFEVQGTLLTIARRFEKLERWTVSHVRALEERMGDVERWLVEKEKEKTEKGPNATGEEDSLHSSTKDDERSEKDGELADVREELAELQGRMGELGREMAKMMAASSHSNIAPPRSAASPTNTMPLTPSSIIPRSLPSLPATSALQRTPSTSSQSRGREITSPSSLHTSGSRTRLPYPTGDYTSPTSETGLKMDALSPASSPPPSIGAARKRPISIAGLPSSSGSITSHLSSSSTSGLPRQSSVSPLEVTKAKSTSTVSLVAPPKQNSRQTSVSPTPTPRKRYTVALGKPLHGPTSGDDDEEEDFRRMVLTPDNLTGSDVSDADDRDSEVRRFGHSRDDTIGKSDSNPPATPSDSIRRSNARTTNVTPRARAQSSYGPITGSSALSTPSPASSVSPLKPRVRSQSTDRIGLGIRGSGSGSQGKFVDPLVVRKQEKEASTPKTPKTPLFGRGKVPIGQLVAFFDGDKK